METEFSYLKKRYNLKGLQLYFNPELLKRKKIEAQFNYVLFEIALKDRRVCRRRLSSLLHEICHAIQYKEKRLIVNRRDLRKMYELEYEAEMFSINEYEEIYAPRFGTILNEPWTLGDYKDYVKFFKKYIGPGYGSIL
jgi:ferritin-like protein